jgi:hypothetical protein
MLSGMVIETEAKEHSWIKHSHVPRGTQNLIFWYMRCTEYISRKVQGHQREYI